MRAPVQPRVSSTAVFLTVLIAFQSAGWVLAWQGLQFGAKTEAQKMLSQARGPLPERTFHKAFIEKIKVVGKKEIILDGKLFDYQILADTGDSLRLKLYNDHHEQALLSVLGQIFKTDNGTKMPSGTPVALWLAQWLGSAFLLPEKPLVSPRVAFCFQQQNFKSLPFTAQSAPSIFSPPPELMV